MIYDAVIVGGGLSGLAAAISVANDGGTVALLERSPKPGGRCYSYRDLKTGDVVDNGQHVLLGAYRNLLRYLSLTGTRGLLTEQSSLTLPFHHPERGHGLFRLSRLPAPMHVSAGILRYGLLTLRERRDLLRAGLALKTGGLRGLRKIATLTVDEWLRDLGQTENARRCFWDPISVSVMNELPGRSSAFLFAGSIRKAFLGPHADSRMLIPAVGQTELYVDGARRLLERGGSTLRAGTTVRALRIRDGRADGVILGDGSVVRGNSVISAVPYYSLPGLLSPPVRNSDEFRRIGEIESSPIVSVNVWFDREFMEEELVGMIGGTVQWLFNRRRILGEGNARPGYLSGVISAARAVVGLPASELVRIVTDEIRTVYPGAGHATVTHSVVIKERRATFSATPPMEMKRPDAGTGIRNFYLAGDWTNTGLPATIEGAVQSGFTAAKLVVR